MSDQEQRAKDNMRQGGIGVGIGAGTTFFERNSQIDKYHTKQGHGFAAEDANALHDTLRGKSVNKVGTDNAPDGADRIVNGVSIQVKYCKTPEDTYRAFFDSKDGTLRYDDMTWEVPKGQGDAVKAKLREDIRQGKIHAKDGTTITDPNMADEMVREGNVTYEQAKNIAKAGNIDSIKFDIANSAITCSCVFGISFCVSLAFALWDGKSVKDSVKDGLSSALTAGLETMVISVASQQLLRTKLIGHGTKIAARYLTRAVWKSGIGKSAIQHLASALAGKTLTGAAAMNVVSKTLRSNVVTSVISTAVITAPDFYRAAFAGSISWKQFSKNLAVNVSSVAGGAAGWFGGVATGATLGSVVPVVGTAIGGVIGGVIGAFGGGALAGKAAKAVADSITPDDSKEMLDLCQEVGESLAYDYLLSEKECHEFIKKLQGVIDLDFLRRMYASSGYNSGRRTWARERFEPLVQDIVKQRHPLITPTKYELSLAVAEILDESLDSNAA